MQHIDTPETCRSVLFAVSTAGHYDQVRWQDFYTRVRKPLHIIYIVTKVRVPVKMLLLITVYNVHLHILSYCVQAIRHGLLRPRTERPAE